MKKSYQVHFSRARTVMEIVLANIGLSFDELMAFGMEDAGKRFDEFYLEVFGHVKSHENNNFLPMKSGKTRHNIKQFILKQASFYL